MSIKGFYQALCNRVMDKRLFHLLGFPFSFRIIYDPNALLAVLKKHKMSTDDLDKISFVQGEIDRVLGSYNLLTGEVIIDVHEIAARLPFPHPEMLDAAITESLAHELRHSWQRKNYSWLRIKWDQIAMLVGFALIGCGLFVYPFLQLWFSITPELGFLTIPFLALFFFLANFALRIILKLSAVLSYRWCWCERDARAYAKKATQDGSWEKVIETQIEIF